MTAGLPDAGASRQCVAADSQNDQEHPEESRCAGHVGDNTSPMRVLVVAVVALLAGQQQPVFKSGVELVTVPITVTNATRDQLITAGLNTGDFRIFEDEVPQTITSLTQERRPVSLAVVADASGSMASARRHDHGVQALQTLARGLEKDDELLIVRFAGSSTVAMPWARAMDPRKAGWRLDPGAGTVANSSITDAVKLAVEQIDQASNPRRAIVIISDGYENTSVTPLSQLARTRQQSETTVYAFATTGPPERGPNGIPLQNILPKLVGDTGGVFWNISTPTEADFAAMSLLNELKYQYLLAYSPATPFDGKYRRLRVETTVKGLAVRHRGGYLAIHPE